MQKAIAVAAEHRPGALVVKYDFKNAYNSLTRAAVREGLEHGKRAVLAAHAVQLPDVAPTLATGITTHWWVDAVNEASDVRAERGVDQGCPLSPALFALAIGPALGRLAAALKRLDPDALVFAYLDDVVIHVGAQHADEAGRLVAAEFGPLGLELNADKTAVWSPDAGIRPFLPDALQERWACAMPVLGSAIPYVRASYPDPDDVDPAADAPATERALVALNGFQAELAQLRTAGLPTMVAQAIHRTYVNGAVTHLLRGQLQDTAWCESWDYSVGRFWASLVHEDELSPTQLLQVHLPLASEVGGCGVQSARWRREAAFLGSWHLCLSAVAATLRFASAGQLLAAGARSVRGPLDEAASSIREVVPGYSFMADQLFEEPEAKRQAELMDAVHAARAEELLAALWVEDPTGAEAAEAQSSGGPHAADFLLPPSPGEPGDKVMMMAEKEFVTALRARLRVKYPAFLPCFQRERGPAQHCNHQYSKGSTVCGQLLVRVDGTPDTRGTHQQLCNVGGGVDQRHNNLRDWIERWLLTVCHVPSAKHEQHVPEWDEEVQATHPVTGAPLTRAVPDGAGGSREEPVMVVEQAKLDVSFRDDEGTEGHVDVSFANACSTSAAATLRAARTAGKAASETEDRKRKRYPPAKHPHAELIPFVVEARGRLGAEVLPFLRQHAPVAEPQRSAALARALREVSIITQQGLAALLLAAEPRPCAA